MRRRSAKDTLADRDRPHWLVATTLSHGLLSCRAISPGADLYAVMREAQAGLQGLAVQQGSSARKLTDARALTQMLAVPVRGIQ